MLQEWRVGAPPVLLVTAFSEYKVLLEKEKTTVQV